MQTTVADIHQLLSTKNYQTVYDLAHTGYQHWLEMVGGLIFVVVGLVLFVRRKENPTSFPEHWTRLGPLFVMFFGILWIGVFALNYSLYARLHNAVGREEYRTVEGRVTEFIPMPYEGHADESFVVNGHRFSYSDYDLTKGFNWTQSHGGPIREGLQVRIAYVDDSIVKLEIAK